MFYHNIKETKSLSHRLGFESACAALCKWAACACQTLSKTFANSLNMQKQFEKLLGQRVITRTRHWLEYIPLKTTFRFIFHHNINDKEIVFFQSVFQSASWKRHCVTHWREQRGKDSYLPRQISQSDCEISSNCGKKSIRTRVHSANHVCEISTFFVLLDKFFCLFLNENLLLLNFLSRFFHLVAFIWEF